MIILLLVAGAASIFLGDYIEAVSLFAVVIANVVIGFVQEMKAEKALEELKNLSVPHAVVLRDGQRKQIEARQVVTGDIVILEEGSQIPADMRITESINLEVNEALLTGESEPVDKTTDPLPESEKALGDQTNMGFMSTLVVKGRGTGVVVATGIETEIGKISKTLTSMEAKNETLLQKRLKRLGAVLIVLSVVLCGVIVGIGFLREYLADRKITGKTVELWIKVGVSLAVSVIPEGLVAVVTVTMALGVQRMARRNAIVRKLTAVETLGSITTICADKTGTLTVGKMKLEELWIGSRRYKVGGLGYDPTKGKFEHSDGKEVELKSKEKSIQLLTKAIMICALCNNSTLQQDPESKAWEGLGDTTEVALEVAARKSGMGKQFWVDQRNFKMISEIPFDSDRMRMTVIGTVDSDRRNHCYAFSKGAPGQILKICSKAIWDNDQIVDMSESMREEIEARSSELATRGLRILALAIRELDVEIAENSETGDEVESDMLFLGLVGLFDPPRREVKPAIEQCRKAGINVCVITGDHHKTAFGIACSLGILQEHELDHVMRGPDIEKLTDEQLAAMQPFPTVFARVSPEHKLKIIRALKLRGEVCAMMGDGVNDAPAIRRADTGISMGIGATELTKQAADIILTDDNFTSIIPALQEGRRTYDNIKKFCMYLFACNSAEIWVMLIAISVGLPAPFTPIMILWANLVVDIPPSLALGIDNADPEVLSRKPRDPKQGIFTWKSTLLVLAHGLVMAGITLGLFSYAIYVRGYEAAMDPDEPGPARALAFIGLAVLQLVHAFLSRSHIRSVFSRDIISNRWLILAVFVSLLSLVGALYIPFLRNILHQWPLHAYDWLAILVAVVVHIAIVEIIKAIVRWRIHADKEKQKSDHFFMEV